ncbi:MAG: hypothetical protein GC160_00445 [Acidobacteria bacterium]|nr:hypothetical protein [Acidobacteriota bacterium]
MRVVVLVLAASVLSAASAAEITQRVRAEGAPSSWKAIPPDQAAMGGELENGVSLPFTLGPVATATLYTGANAFRITVPAGAKRLEVRLATATSGARTDLFLRYGYPPELTADGGVLTHFGAAGYSGYEALTVTASSTPALQAGVYYVALGLATTGVQASGTVTATYSMTDAYAGTTLESDAPSSFSLPAVSSPTLFTGSYGYRIVVPEGATRLTVAAMAAIPNAAADVDLYLRRDAEPAVAGTAVTADHESTLPAGSEEITVDASSSPPLRAGVYYVALALHTFGTNVEGLVSATVTTTAPIPPALSVAPASLSFVSQVGATPSAQSLTVRNSGGGTLTYSIATSQPWLAASPASGSSTGEADAIAVSVATAGLGEGVRQGELRVEAGAAGSVAIPVTLTLEAVTPPPPGPPVITSDSVVNGADFTSELSPGILLSIFGLDLAPATVAAQSAPLPTSLAGACAEALVGGQWTPLPLFFVSPGQINAQLLYEIPVGAVSLRVRTDAGVSEAVSIVVSERSPRLLTTTLDGRGDPILLHADYSLVSATHPATPGEALVLYLSGLGPVSPAVPSGHRAGDGSAGSPLNLVEPAVTVRVAAREAAVYYAGLAPGWIGLYQVNFQTPPEAGFGALPLTVEVEDQGSQSFVGYYCDLQWQTVGGATVGSGGGTVYGGSISVAVPPGVFADAAQVTIERALNAPAGSPNDVSEAFAISGLPLATNGPLTVEADALGALPTGDVYLVVSERGDGSDSLWVPARVAQGRLTADLPARAAPPADELRASLRDEAHAKDQISAGLWQRVTMAFVGGYRTRSQGRFRVTYPQTLAVDELIAGFEQAERRLGALGFTRLAGAPSPIDVRVRSARGPEEPWGEVRNALWTRATTIQVSEALLNGPVSLVQPKAAHLLMHYSQGLYDPRAGTALASYPLSSWLWFDEASAIWFERWFGPSAGDFVPAEALENRRFLTKRGLELPLVTEFLNSNIDEVRRHGYGASMFVESLNSRQFPTDSAWLARLYAAKATPSAADSSTPALSPVDALGQSLQVPLASAWTSFVVGYLMGEVYPDGQGWREIPGWKDELAIAPTVAQSQTLSDESPVSFSWKAGDLSVRFYRVVFDGAWAQSHSDSTLNVQIASTGGVGAAVVFDTVGGEIRGFAGAVNVGEPALPQDVSRLARDGANLYIAAINTRARSPFDESGDEGLRATAVRHSGDADGGRAERQAAPARRMGGEGLVLRRNQLLRRHLGEQQRGRLAVEGRVLPRHRERLGADRRIHQGRLRGDDAGAAAGRFAGPRRDGGVLHDNAPMRGSARDDERRVHLLGSAARRAAQRRRRGIFLPRRQGRPARPLAAADARGQDRGFGGPARPHRLGRGHRLQPGCLRRGLLLHLPALRGLFGAKPAIALRPGSRR